MPTTTVNAPAKINLFLRVLGRRGDGYHDLESLVVPISLADRLEIHAASDPGEFRTLSFSLEVSGEPDVVRGVPVDESNLVLAAAKALANRTGVRGFADVHLEKRIPSAAGLGGGSSDAAATLRALNDLWQTGLSEEELISVAAEVGSDVPAMMRPSPVLIRGRGDRVASVGVPALEWVLVTLDMWVATGDAYAWWDQDRAVTGPDPAEVLAAVAADPGVLGPLLFNDLQASVVRRNPRIGRVRDMLLRAGASGAILCGSGPSVAGLLPSGRRLAQKVVGELEKLSGRAVTYVRSQGSERSR